MAGIDKIYGNLRNWIKLVNFLMIEKPEYLKHVKTWEYDLDSEDVPIAHFTEKQDSWLWRHCKLQFVRERLKEQYSNTDLDYWDTIVRV